MRLDHLLSKGKSEGRPPIGETRWRACEEAVAAAAGPKRREPMAAGARQYEKRKRRVRLSKPNVLHPEGCCHPEGEGYLAEESQALELDKTKSGGRNGQLSIHSAFVSFSFEGTSHVLSMTKIVP